MQIVRAEDYWVAAWVRTGLLRKVHAWLIALLRGNPDLILDSGSGAGQVRLEIPNRDHRGWHSVACMATAANVNGTVLFERLFLTAFAVLARIATVFADKGDDAEANRTLCRRFGTEPHTHKRRQPHGSGLGQRRWSVERGNAWVLENKRLTLRYDRLGIIIQSLLERACTFLVARHLAQEF